MDHMTMYEAAFIARRWPQSTIAAGRRHTVGLQADGTVLAVGDNPCGECAVSGWRGIQYT